MEGVTNFILLIIKQGESGRIKIILEFKIHNYL
jgi:hypothetical protein